MVKTNNTPYPSTNRQITSGFALRVEALRGIVVDAINEIFSSHPIARASRARIAADLNSTVLYALMIDVVQRCAELQRLIIERLKQYLIAEGITSAEICERHLVWGSSWFISQLHDPFNDWLACGLTEQKPLWGPSGGATVAWATLSSMEAPSWLAEVMAGELPWLLSIPFSEHRVYRRQDASWPLKILFEPQLSEHDPTLLSHKNTLEALARLEQILQFTLNADADKIILEYLADPPLPGGQPHLLDGSPTVPIPTSLIQVPARLESGQNCHKMLDEIKRVKRMYFSDGSNWPEIKAATPDFKIWNHLFPTLSEQDRETFMHPRQWGPVNGYALALLGRLYGRSSYTIRDWIKKFRKFAKSARIT
jgi:hypothetical protein